MMGDPKQKPSAPFIEQFTNEIVYVTLPIRRGLLVTHPTKEVNRQCIQPYWKHPKGCPNFNSKEGCPPGILHIEDEYDLNKPIFLLAARFPFLKFISEKKIQHPDWSMRALINQRHWQPTSKKNFWENVELFLQEHPEYNVLRNPEGQGVNIPGTARNCGIDIQWCKTNERGEIVSIPEYMYHVSIAAIPFNH